MCACVCPTLLALPWQVARDREVVINNVETEDKQFEKSTCSVNIVHNNCSILAERQQFLKSLPLDSHSAVCPSFAVLKN